ncbi:hypothetical protein ACH4E9_22700 [Streptomyces anulatus]|uniref:hypothetical protein n=1 Tax=Streptomyces anulatus TaxID=1892 RepID=UPI00225B7068|nr:hypothetical protein [Streptomyces anulatus]MCX4502463.1 hypothetical protein [Streptomyces anulatus]
MIATGFTATQFDAEGHGIKDEDVARLSHRLEVISTGGQADCASEAGRRPGDVTVM